MSVVLLELPPLLTRLMGARRCHRYVVAAIAVKQARLVASVEMSSSLATVVNAETLLPV